MELAEDVKLLYFCPVSRGGLADYAREQANAISEFGVSVDLLTVPGFNEGQHARFSRLPRLKELGATNEALGRVRRRIAAVRTILHNFKVLSETISVGGYKHVLLGSFSEYLAPLWSDRFRRWAKSGVIFGAIVHDPVRDFELGPTWWHRWSIACAYSFLRETFVHEPIELDTVRNMPGLRTTVIPHGPYCFQKPTDTRDQARSKWKLPAEAKVMLSFGHIRDGKNLDLAIRAMADYPSLYLIVAGKGQSSGQKPLSYYQNIARSLNVDDRCRWLYGYVPEEDVGNLFLASDLVLLTYSRDFRSASGVLNAAIFYRKPCIASGGASNLRTSVHEYNLGIWAEPDDLESLIKSIRKFTDDLPLPKWDEYLARNSWQSNAAIVVGALMEGRDTPR